MEQAFVVLSSMLVNARIQTLKSFAWTALNFMYSRAKQDLKDEKEGGNTWASTFEDQRVKEMGLDGSPAPIDLATLYCAIDAELKVIGTNEYDYLEPLEKVIARKAEQKFDPTSKYGKDKIADLMHLYELTEAEAIHKLQVRQERFNTSSARDADDIVARIETLLSKAEDRDYEDAFNALTPVHRLKFLNNAISSLESEKVRCKRLGIDRDWDDMLERSNDMKLEVNTLIEAKRPLLAKAQADE